MLSGGPFQARNCARIPACAESQTRGFLASCVDVTNSNLHNAPRCLIPLLLNLPTLLWSEILRRGSLKPQTNCRQVVSAPELEYRAMISSCRAQRATPSGTHNVEGPRICVSCGIFLRDLHTFSGHSVHVMGLCKAIAGSVRSTVDAAKHTLIVLKIPPWLFRCFQFHA